MRRRDGWRRLGALLGAVLAVGCGGQAGETRLSEPADMTTTAAPESAGAALRLYTTVTQDTVDAVVSAYREEHPGTTVDVFRAPTGELAARIAAEQREGGLQADVLWLTDPLSMQQYDDQDLLAPITSVEADAVPSQYRSDTFVGTRILNMVIVHQAGLDPAPTSWQDLTNPAYRGAVAFPDPSFAGSAFGALGYFALTKDFGIGYYRDLAANGAVQVQAPDEVTNGVAEGRFVAGMTLDNSARAAAEKGSPITVVAPEPGAIAIYSPIAVVADTANSAAATEFVSFVLTPPAQQAIAATGWEPVIDGVAWPHDLPQVFPDWEEIAGRAGELLREYTDAFSG